MRHTSAGGRRRAARAARAAIVSGLVLLAVAAGACEVGRGGARSAHAVPPNPFAADPLWDDGRAEVSAYEASEARYGIPRPFTAYLIVVKEPFSRTRLVKADPGHEPADVMSVLKMNQVIELRTGVYSYHQMASTFFDRHTMDLLKFSLASFEWCGNTFKEYTRSGRQGSLHAHTYWDGMDQVTYPIIVSPDLVFYDQMPLWIRSLPQSVGTRRDLRLVPSQIGSRAAPPASSAAVLEAMARETATSPAGSHETTRWELRPAGGLPDRYWTAVDPPHLLVAWERSDGGSYRLIRSQRLAYWEMNHPGEERDLTVPEGH